MIGRADFGDLLLLGSSQWWGALRSQVHKPDTKVGELRGWSHSTEGYLTGI